MYISDIKNRARKAVVTYSCVTMFCCLFSAVYEHFSHGVYSDYMIYLFLFPLFGGVVPFLSITLIRRLPFPGRLAMNLYNSGVAALSVGSCIKGILEIYGTTSNYEPVYWTAGILFVIIGAAVYIAGPASKI